MRVSVAASAVVLAFALGSLPAAGQSLGEAAAREKARRDKLAREGKARPPVKVITEDELRGRVSSGTLSQPAAVDGATAAAPAEGAAADGSAPGGSQGARPAQPEKSEEELRAERQAEWSKKLQEARADVARLRARVDQMQTALNDMTGPIYGPNRASIANQLEQGKAALATAEQTVASLEEEGRRNRYR
jgi:DNA repair exonuclease SbcCD ATPase subunit